MRSGIATVRFDFRSLSQNTHPDPGVNAKWSAISEQFCSLIYDFAIFGKALGIGTSLRGITRRRITILLGAFFFAFSLGTARVFHNLTGFSVSGTPNY
jgi:hypothetical protein